MLTRKDDYALPFDPRQPRVGVLVFVIAGLLVMLPPLLGAGLVVGAMATSLVVIRPRWGFYLLLLSIPVQDMGAVGELTLTNVLFALTLVAWLARRAAIADSPPLPRSPVGPFFTIFVAALALSLVAARELGPGIAALFQWTKALIVYFMALDLLRTRHHVLAAIAALLLAGAAEALVGLVQSLFSLGPESYEVGEQVSRAYGSFGRPNSYAGYLEMILPVGIVVTAWLWRERRATSRSWLGLVLAGGATSLIGIAILASFSRGAWLGTLGAIAAMLFLAGPRSRWTALTGSLVAGLAGLLGGFALLPASIRDRVVSIVGDTGGTDVRTAYITAENFAIVERRAHWEAGLNMFASDRLLGIGLGNFNVRYTEFNVSPTFTITQGHAHNYYIHVAAEAGLIGLGTYLLLLAAIVISGLHALRVTAGGDRFARAVVVGALGVVAAVGIHNLFENLHVLSLGIQLSTVWAFFAIAARGFPPDSERRMASNASAAQTSTETR